MNTNTKIKTEDELYAEWGQERFVEALRILSGWHLDRQHPISIEQLDQLRGQNKDALELFGSRLYYQSKSNA